MPVVLQKTTKREREINFLSKLRNTAEIRSFSSPILKSLSMIESSGLPIRMIAKFNGVSYQSVFRAHEATKSNREIGKAGRPSYLNKEQVQNLVVMVKKAQENRSALTRKEIIDLVSFFFFLNN